MVFLIFSKVLDCISDQLNTIIAHRTYGFSKNSHVKTTTKIMGFFTDVVP